MFAELNIELMNIAEQEFGSLDIVFNNAGRSGSIINTAFIAALSGSGGALACSATKAAVVHITNAAAEFAKHNIRVNAICPGPVDTEMLGSVEEFIDERNSEVARARINQSIPLGRYGKPEEVAGAAAFLLSQDAAFVTGILMPVDGASR